MKIAYLSCEFCFPGERSDQVDMREHQHMMSALKPVFESNGSTIKDVKWDAKQVDWSTFDAVIIGTAWDYIDRCDEFLATLDAIDTHTPVFNRPSTVRWNCDKNYLRTLEAKGIGVIPTLWIDDPQSIVDWPAAFKSLGTEKLVVKRQIGANATGQFLLNKGATAETLSHPMMIQPFLTAVADEGEYSFIFVDGELSHCLIKKPSSGDYRIQATYGGIEAAITPAQKDITKARSVLRLLDELPLYARVDMVRGADGSLLLMELELIEPFLYPLQGPDFANHLFTALSKRLAGHSQ